LWFASENSVAHKEVDNAACSPLSFGAELNFIRKLCALDIVCDFVGERARIPYAGRYVGIEALINLVRSVAIDFEQAHCSISEILVEDSRVTGHRGSNGGI
jgi:hypothetical protein